MSSPTELAMSALKRLGRYLIGKPRLVFRYPFQEAGTVDCYSDTDWAGCPRTRKSTSGGVILLGEHILKTYSSTQPTVSLSSGEAEFYGVVRASGAALGQQSLFADLGVPLDVRVWTDSSAAMGICTRQGLGKLRHIDTQTLWVQEKVRTKQITLKKVLGELNPADLLTKFLTGKEKLDQLIKLFGLVAMTGRAKSAPMLRRKKALDGDCDTPVDDDQELYVMDDIDESGVVVVPEALRHDLEVWPHLHSEELQAKLFPTAVSVPEIETIDEEAKNLHRDLHRRWAATRLVISRG